MSTDDVAQRARQFLDLAGKSFGVTIEVWNGMVAYEAALRSSPDLVRDLLALVEVALPTITAQRDDALAEVERLRADLEGAAYRAGQQQGKLARAEAAVDRAWKLADDWEQNGMPAFEVPSLLAAAQLRRALVERHRRHPPTTRRLNQARRIPAPRHLNHPRTVAPTTDRTHLA